MNKYMLIEILNTMIILAKRNIEKTQKLIAEEREKFLQSDAQILVCAIVGCLSDHYEIYLSDLSDMQHNLYMVEYYRDCLWNDVKTVEQILRLLDQTFHKEWRKFILIYPYIDNMGRFHNKIRLAKEFFEYN